MVVSAIVFGKALCYSGVQRIAAKHDARIRCEHVQIGIGGLSLIDPVIEGPFGHIEMAALRIGIHIDLRHFKITPHLTLEHPIWDVGAADALAREKSTAVHIDVVDGIVRHKNTELPIAFTSGKGEDFGLLEIDRGALEVMFKKGTDGLSTIARFKHTQLERLQPILVFLFPSNSWEPISGNISGYLSADVTGLGSVSQVDGELLVDEWEFWHPTRQLKVGSQKLAWSGKLPKGGLRLDDGYILATHPRLPAPWSVHLSGKLTAKEEQVGQVVMAGFIRRGDESFPLAIAGEESVDSDADLHAAFHISGQGSSTVSLTLDRSGSGSLRGTFREISSNQLLMFRDSLATFFPVFRDLSLEGEGVDARVAVKLQKRCLTSIIVEDVFADKVNLLWPSMHVDASGQNIHLTGQLPFKETPQWFDASWTMDIETGRIRDIEDVSVSIATENGIVKKGDIEGHWKGITFNGALEGTTREPSCRLSAASDTQQIAQIFNFESEGSDALELRLLIDRDENKWSAAGRLKVADGRLTFGATLARQPEIWLEGERVPHSLYGLVLSHLNVDGKVTGKINVSGKVKTKHCDLNITSHHLNYQSPLVNVDLYQQKPLHVSYSGDAFQLKIPLTGAHLKERTYGLVFDRLDGMVHLDDKHLYSRDLIVKAYGNEVKTHLSLDVEGGDLNIAATHIDGTAEGTLELLRHFDRFKAIKLPITGRLISLDDHPFTLHAPLMRNDGPSFTASLNLQNGRLPITNAAVAEALTCDIKFTSDDDILYLQAVDGELKIADGYAFDLSAPYIKVSDIDAGNFQFDVRIENATHDLMRFEGTLQDFAQVTLETESHLFGNAIKLASCDFAQGAFAGATNIDLAKLPIGLRLIKSFGHLNISSEEIQSIENAALKGCVAADIKTDPTKNTLTIDLNGSDLKFKQLTVPHFALKVEHEDDVISLDHLIIGEFQARALANKQPKGWDLSLLEIDWGGTKLQTFSGELIDGIASLNLEHARIDLKRLRPLFGGSRINPFLNGQFDISGELHLDIEEWEMTGHMGFSSDTFTDANLCIQSMAPMQFNFKRHRSFEIDEAAIEIWHESHHGQIDIQDFKFASDTWSSSQIRADLSPEIIHAFAEHRLIPQLDILGSELLIGHIPIRWDNHLDASLSFSYSLDNLSLQASIKDGYYWLGDASCYLQNAHFQGDNDSLNFSAHSKLNNADFIIDAQFPFDPNADPQICLNGDPEYHDEILRITFSRSNQRLQSVHGTFCGFNCNLEYNASNDHPSLIPLTGNVKIDWNAAARLLPQSLSTFILNAELGRGYQLTGDLLFNVQSPRKSTFRGYFKGRDFELLGCRFKSLLANIEYDPDYILLQELSLADAALALTLPQINISHGNISIPTLTIQDLRPSLLNRPGKRNRRLKPFVVRNLTFHKISGNLSDITSFSGRGKLSFINTFKRDTTLLDIPKDLISRIGLDVGLLVPVCGELTCELSEGRLYLKELNQTFSEGERSQFFLSPRTASYVSLDGQLNIDIRMKQSVLLKVREPYTIAIRGTLARPKYKLK